MNDLVLTHPHSHDDRVVHEYWPTPGWCVDALMRRLARDPFALPPGGPWCEPCVGDGAIVRAVGAFRAREPEWFGGWPLYWYSCDIREVPAESKAVTHFPGTDFRRAFGEMHFDVVITNPPFSLAQDVKIWARKRADHVILLQRLNWLGSRERGPWWRDDMPDVYVLERRPSFDGKGTDGCEYAWFHWHGEPKRSGKVEVLACD